MGDLRMSSTHSSTKSLIAANYIPLEIVQLVREIILKYREKTSEVLQMMKLQLDHFVYGTHRCHTVMATFFFKKLIVLRIAYEGNEVHSTF